VFDIGFTELLLCLVVALVVIGPEQLPGTVRTVALWLGRLKRSLAETRSEIERQIGADDIRRQLHNEEILRNIEETRLQIEATIREHGLNDLTQEISNNVQEITNGLDYQNGPEQQNVLEHQPSAADYGPPEELPDHSHGPQTSNQQKPAVVANTVAPVANVQPAQPQPTSASVPAQHNNQQSQAPVAPTTAPQNTVGVGQ
jgi:sec-independent protein translocase protein TatB